MIPAGAVLLLALLSSGIEGGAAVPVAAATPSRRLQAPAGAPSPPPATPGGSALRESRAGIDWHRRVLRCNGVAPPRLAEETENVAVTRLRTERSAHRAAVQACVDALRTITVTEGLTAGELMDRDAALQQDIERVIRRAPVVDAPRLFSDGGVALRLAVPVDGRISDLLFGAADRLRRVPSP